MATALLAALLATQIAAADPLTAPIGDGSAWLGPQAPTRLYGNTYYVGSSGLSLALIDTGAGLILVDGGLPQGVADTEARIRQLGFKVTDIKFILNTESHYDHSSGIAALARDSGATALTSASGAEALRRGRSDPADPQAAALPPFPAVGRVRAVRDGETLRLGSVTVTAHMTPGHSPGSTSWSWRACEGAACRSVVFASSLNPISAGAYRYTARPEVVAGFRNSFQTVRALPCEVLITAHPQQSRLADQLKRGGPFVDPAACRAYADEYEALFERRIAQERAGRAP